MGRREAIAVAIEDQTRQQARRLRAHGQRPLASIGGEPVLNDLPKFRIDDRLVLAGVDFALVGDLAAIEPVLQHQVERAARETACRRRAVRRLPRGAC